MVLIEPEKKHLTDTLRDTVPVLRKKQSSEKEGRILDYLDRINDAGYVVDRSGNLFEVGAIADNDIHLIPVEHRGEKINPKGHTKKMFCLSLEEMMGEYKPCELKGENVEDYRKRNLRDTVESPKVIKPVDKKLEQEAEIAQMQRKQRVLQVERPYEVTDEERRMIRSSKKPEEVKKEPEPELKDESHNLTETPFAKTPEQRKALIARRIARKRAKESEPELKDESNNLTETPYAKTPEQRDALIARRKARERKDTPERQKRVA